MIEAPEALMLAMQLNKIIRDKTINHVIAAQTPHKFTWYHDGPESYPDKLNGKTVKNCSAFGGMVEINMSSDTTLLFCDGANLRYYSPGEKLPVNHQLLVGFSDESCLVVSVRMYGGLFCFTGNKLEGNFSSYYLTARTKPQVMSETFDLPYFLRLINEDHAQNKSAKAFLATRQTIPGLGNGVLQDILYMARIHPKTKIKELDDTKKRDLFFCIKKTLQDIYDSNGRNCETDIFGQKGKYIPFLSKDTAGTSCKKCGEYIRKDNYMGGSIYYCPECQPLSGTKIALR